MPQNIPVIPYSITPRPFLKRSVLDLLTNRKRRHQESADISKRGLGDPKRDQNCADEHQKRHPKGVTGTKNASKILTLGGPGRVSAPLGGLCGAKTPKSIKKGPGRRPIWGAKWIQNAPKNHPKKHPKITSQIGCILSRYKEPK